MRNIKLLAVVALVTLLGVISCSKEDAVSSEADQKSTARVSENLVVASQSFDLNIIGVPQNYQGTWPDMPNTIFVPLEGRPKLLLAKADPGSYSILDNLATDGSAKFVLPSSDIDGNGTSSYAIYAKLVGVNGGIFTCSGNNSANSAGYYEVCSAGTLTFRVSGNPRFVSESDQLLNLVVPRGRDINLDSDPEFEIPAGKYPIFDQRLEGNYWQPYGTSGLKLLQLRLVGK